MWLENSMKVECIDKEFDITVGKIYEVIMLENQGEVYQLKNDSGIISNYPACCFRTVEVMRAKCIETINLDLKKDMIYEVVSIDKERNECRVIDESGEDYIYSMDSFEFL